MAIAAFLATLGVAWSHPTSASVELKNGNFYLGYIDVVDHDIRELKLERVYNSKSPYVGIFGLGWAYVFDTSLEIAQDGSATVNEWGGGRTQHLAPGALMRDSAGWTRRDETGRIDTFSTEGRLIRMAFGSGTVLSIRRSATGLIESIADERGRAITFRYNAQSRVIEAKGRSGAAFYDYDEAGMLVHSKDQDGNEFSYEYDGRGRGNMTRVIYRDGTSLDIDYFGQDLFENVQQTRDRNGKTTRYDYGTDPLNPSLTWVEVIEYATANSQETRKRFEFKLDSGEKVPAWASAPKPRIKSGLQQPEIMRVGQKEDHGSGIPGNSDTDIPVTKGGRSGSWFGFLSIIGLLGTGAIGFIVMRKMFAVASRGR
ncbi:MAG TPA: DUF6531 domain-containing protein [Bdellovibrionota bacterium]|nr:DUF6531 domain-containing protein [Bdellovibrionota bacterium]